MPSYLFDFQAFLVDWAVRKGRGAIFTDCGTGKTIMQLVWAENVIRKTNKPVLILTPLAVSSQTLAEAEKFNLEAHRAQPDVNPTAIQVTNYEKLHYFDAKNYSGVVCDESSILKNFDGKRRTAITEFMRQVPYRLLCTATAAPNDWEELGTSSEALGYFGYTDMLGKFFTNKNHGIAARAFQQTRDKWRLRGWAAKGPFWQWVASWARAARWPSDLGFDDADFILPPLKETHTLVKANRPTPGMLFDLPATNFHEEREAIRRTLPERCEAAAAKVAENGHLSMVWCHLNDEGDLLEHLIPNCIQVAGKHSEDYRETAIGWFKGETCICHNPMFRGKIALWKKQKLVTGNICKPTIKQISISGINERKNNGTDTTPLDESDIKTIQNTEHAQKSKSKSGKKKTQENAIRNDCANTESPSMSMTPYLQSKTTDAQFADAKTQVINAEHTSTLTTVTAPEKLEDCSAPTAIWELENSATPQSDLSELQCICGYKSGNRCLVSKPKVLGFGLNFQHCAHMTYFPTHSYEQYYQATRRLWRFGQTRPVTVHLIYTDGGERIMRNLDRKSKAADLMFEELVGYMGQALELNRDTYTKREVEIPQWMSNGK